jgi:hypothetical protein
LSGARTLPIRGVFASLALIWPAVLVAATRIAALPHRGTGAYLMSAAVYYGGSLICHQRPERSFALWGTPLPVCARCTGIYLGAAIGVIGALVRRTPIVGVRLWPDTPFGAGGDAASGFSRTARVTLVTAALPTALTLVYEWTTGVTPGNWVRAISGVVIGAVAALIVMRAGALAVREVN